MRKLFVFNMVSLDGFFEGPNHNINWHIVDDEFNQFAIEQTSSVDMILFGQVTYELMASYWPTPAATTDDPIVADLMNRLPKIVNPVVLGSGTPLFQGIKDKLKLKLLKTRTFRSGNVLLYYQPDNK